MATSAPVLGAMVVMLLCKKYCPYMPRMNLLILSKSCSNLDGKQIDVVNASGATDVEINAEVLSVPGVGIAPKVIGIPEVETGIYGIIRTLCPLSMKGHGSSYKKEMCF